jgi:tRNA nucleotidyltransferase (CCA-adding enzyme)
MRMEFNPQLCLGTENVQLIQLVARNAANLGYSSYLVGGIVRDILLNRKITDLDMVLDGDPISLVRALEKKYGGRQISHRQFGTANWKIDPLDGRFSSAIGVNTAEFEHAFPESIDLVRARSETYTRPAALPMVTAGSLQDDLLRRDFTINAMAIRVDGERFGELIDPWGGLKDLQKKQIRILHEKSFVDDPTRILRAVRFEQRLGFRLEDRTLTALKKSRDYIKHVSGARIRNELEHILAENDQVRILTRLRELNILSSIHPGLDWTPELKLPFEHAKKVLPYVFTQTQNVFGKMSLKTGLALSIWFLTFPRERFLAISNRLCLPAGLTKTIQSAQSLWNQKEYINNLSTSEATFFLDRYEVAAICAVMCYPLGAKLNHSLDNYQKKWRFVKPITSGAMLKELGIPAGPQFKHLLKELRAAWLDGKVKSSQEERIFLAKLLKKIGYENSANLEC